MPHEEGLALYDAALSVNVAGPYLEVGSYCGKSAVYIGSAAATQNRQLFAVDHHRGSEENQPGWEWHDPDLVDPQTGRLDTLPHFRHNIEAASLEQTVIAVVGQSAIVAANWNTPLAFLFIDGGHGQKPAHEDYEGWSPHVTAGGLMAIHDVFPNPADGGRPPHEIYERALGDQFEEVSSTGSLRILQKTS